MPLENRKTNSTKELIYLSAKREFYEKGYKGTIKSIAERAGIPPGLVTYYFKTKDNLISEIYKDFYRKIGSLIDSYEYLNITNSLYKQIVLSHIYYGTILNDENNRRFYMEVRAKRSSNYKLLHEVTDTIYWEYIKDFNLSITKKEFDILMIMQSAARRDFFLYYYKNNLDMTIPEIVNTVEAIVPRLFKINQDVVDRYLLQAQNVVKEIDYSNLKFLV